MPWKALIPCHLRTANRKELLEQVISNTGPDDETDLHSSADDISVVNEDWELVPFVAQPDPALKRDGPLVWRHQNRTEVLYSLC